MVEKKVKLKEDYPLFWLPFLPKVFAGSGAAFVAGATFFFSLFDVGITSFSVGFLSVLWFCHVLLFSWFRDIRFVPAQEFKRF